MQPAVKSAVFSQPPSLDDISVADGHEVFLKNCSGCHGSNADGRSPGGRALRPVAFDFAGFQLTNAAVWRALGVGVAGLSMSAWPLLPHSAISAGSQFCVAAVPPA